MCIYMICVYIYKYIYIMYIYIFPPCLRTPEGTFLILFRFPYNRAQLQPNFCVQYWYIHVYPTNKWQGIPYQPVSKMFYRQSWSSS